MAKNKEIQTYIDQLFDIGWFDVIQDKDGYIDKMKLRFIESGSKKFNFALPWICYDGECVYDEGEYAKLLQELSDNSFSMFVPKKIEEKWSGPGIGSIITVTVITSRDEELTQSYEYESDYLDQQFYDFMANVVKSCDSRCTVFNKTGGQDGLLLIGGIEAIQKARKMRLFTK